MVGRAAVIGAKSFAQQRLQLVAVEIAETEARQRASALHKILAADRAADGEKRFRQRRRDAGQFGDRNQKRQAEPQILPHVAMLRSARSARASRRNRSGGHASRGHTSIARLRWRNDAPAENAERHSRSPSRTAIRSASSASVTRRIAALRAFLVNVPALEMLDRAGIHHDQRRMDDRSGIHQRARQRVAARLDHAGKGAADHVERMVGGIERKYADRQPLGADGDGDLERPVLAGQPRQRAGLGKADAGADCRRRARPWRRSSSRRSPAAGTRPGRRSDAARAAARYRAARRPGQGTGSARRRERLRRCPMSPAPVARRAGRWCP